MLVAGILAPVLCLCHVIARPEGKRHENNLRDVVLLGKLVERHHQTTIAAHQHDDNRSNWLDS